MGIAMLRVLENLVGQAVFDDMAGFHHHGSLAEQINNPKIMGDDEHRQIEFAAQVSDQIEDPGLDGEIKAGGDFIEEEDQRVVRQGLGNLHPLLHPTTEVCRRFIHSLNGNFCFFKEFRSSLAHLGDISPAGAEKPLGDIAAGTDPHSEAQVRVLINNTHQGIAHLPSLKVT